jgi:hypothetical protein
MTTTFTTAPGNSCCYTNAAFANNIAARIAMMAMTTNSSINVKAALTITGPQFDECLGQDTFGVCRVLVMMRRWNYGAGGSNPREVLCHMFVRQAQPAVSGTTLDHKG